MTSAPHFSDTSQLSMSTHDEGSNIPASHNDRNVLLKDDIHHEVQDTQSIVSRHSNAVPRTIHANKQDPPPDGLSSHQHETQNLHLPRLHRANARHGYTPYHPPKSEDNELYRQRNQNFSPPDPSESPQILNSRATNRISDQGSQARSIHNHHSRASSSRHQRSQRMSNILQQSYNRSTTSANQNFLQNLNHVRNTSRASIHGRTHQTPNIRQNHPDSVNSNILDSQTNNESHYEEILEQVITDINERQTDLENIMKQNQTIINHFMSSQRIYNRDTQSLIIQQTKIIQDQMKTLNSPSTRVAAAPNSPFEPNSSEGISFKTNSPCFSTTVGRDMTSRRNRVRLVMNLVNLVNNVIILITLEIVNE